MYDNNIYFMHTKRKSNNPQNKTRHNKINHSKLSKDTNETDKPKKNLIIE